MALPPVGHGLGLDVDAFVMSDVVVDKIYLSSGSNAVAVPFSVLSEGVAREQYLSLFGGFSTLVSKGLTY